MGDVHDVEEEGELVRMKKKSSHKPTKKKSVDKEAVEDDEHPLPEDEELSTLKAVNRLLKNKLEQAQREALEVKIQLEMAEAKANHADEQLTHWVKRAVAAEGDLRVQQVSGKHVDESPAKKVKMTPHIDPDEVEDIDEDEDEKPVPKVPLKRKNADATDSAQIFLRHKWLDKFVSFDKRRSSEVYQEYTTWCRERGAESMLSHLTFSRLMQALMPRGYLVGRGSHNQAVVTFNCGLAQADIQAQLEGGERADSKKAKGDKKGEKADN